MTENILLSIAEARKLALHSQKLLQKSSFGKSKRGIVEALNHLGYVQIDAISVIHRAHHHTLWTRVKNYRPEQLYELLSKDRKIFEYWSHAASFLPIDNYRFCLPLMREISKKGKHWYSVGDKIKKYVFDRIKIDGPQFARDFETTKKLSGEMWDLKPAKQALHELFMEGKLAVKARHNFQRLYDLTERVLPAEIDISFPTESEFSKFLILEALRSSGLFTINEVVYQRSGIKGIINKNLKELVEDKVLIPVDIKGNRSNMPFYTSSEKLEQVPQRVVKKIHFLSPFDNAVIQRKRLQQLFGFDYQTEIYYPKNKRIYGYFAMPVLWGTEFIGRIDPKADRQSKTLIVKNLFIEENIRITDYLMYCLGYALREFAEFNNCDHIQLLKSNRPLLMNGLNI